MRTKAFLCAAIMLFSISGCIPTAYETIQTRETITSEPADAEIFWGKTEYSLENSGYKTPYTRQIPGKSIESWCYQVKKDGCWESQVVCKPMEYGERKVHFDLTPKIEYQRFVSVTGAADALKRITTTEVAEYRPRVSPDQRWLLVVVTGAKNSFENSVLEKMDLWSNSKVILTSKENDSGDADWLPDGSAIVYTTDRLKNPTIVQSFGTSGESAVKFITNPSLGPCRFPDVSPNGKEVAFSVFNSKDDSQICIIGTNGNDLRMYGPGWEPVWSPNGEKLVFTRKVGSYQHIYTLDAATGMNLTEYCSTDANDFAPTWSPDGKHIAFISNRTGRQHIFIMKSNGQELIQLTDGKFDVSSISWGPDGYIYFSANAGENWDIWRLRPKIVE